MCNLSPCCFSVIAIITLIILVELIITIIISSQLSVSGWHVSIANQIISLSKYYPLQKLNITNTKTNSSVPVDYFYCFYRECVSKEGGSINREPESIFYYYESNYDLYFYNYDCLYINAEKNEKGNYFWYLSHSVPINTGVEYERNYKKKWKVRSS